MRGSGSSSSANRAVGSFGASTSAWAVTHPTHTEVQVHDPHHHELHQHLTSPPPPPSRNTVPRYSRYPYVERQEGYVQHVPAHGPGAKGRIVAGQVAGEGAYAGDGVWRSGLALRLAYMRVGLDSNLSFYIDRGRTDALYLGSTNLILAPVMRPHVMWWVGGGANYMLDGRVPGQGRREYAAGYNFTSSVDVFPFSPIVLSGRFDVGTIHAARVMSARATVGIVLRGFELYGGYEAKKVGDVPLHGPMVGIRAWF